MRKFIVATDSTSCLKYITNEDENIEVLPLYLFIKGERKQDNIDVSTEAFIKWMRANPKESPHSAPPDETDIDRMIRRWIQKGYTDALFVTLSAAISQTYSLVQNVAKRYQKDINIAVFDSKSQSFPQVMLLLEGKRLLEKGFSLPAVVTRLEFIRRRGEMFFTIYDLEYLVRYGRINIKQSMMSKLFKVHPILKFDDSGKIIRIGQQRGLNEALKDCILRCEQFIEDREADIFVTHARDPDGINFEEKVRAYFKEQNIISLPTSPVIACHTGPGVYGIGAYLSS